jgi:phosphoglycolate phosphatase
MLDRARDVASALFVATSKPAVYADRIVEHFGLDAYFAGVYGSELDGRFDDKADLLAHLFATAPVAADAAIMIGDRAVDVVAARAHGARSIGALWGYGSEDELRDAGADWLCRTPAELATCIAEITGHAPGGHASDGRRSNQGRAASSCAPSRNSVASSP